MVGQSIEQRGRHLGIAEHTRPFTEGEIGGYDDRGAFIEPADEMEEKLTASLGEGQIAELIENHKIEACEVISKTALAAGAGFGFQPIDQIDDIVEAATRTAADTGASNGNGEMAFAGSGRSRDILPGIRTAKARSSIGSIRATARRWRSLGGTARAAPTS